VGGQLYVYHEKQDAGLCAVHCLNALLQGHYFTEVDLMMLARELDEKEKQMMMEMGTDTREFLTYMAEDSGNVADDGNYSIQVIAKALAVWNLLPIPITNSEAGSAKQNPLGEQAFVCNLASHWLTVRKIGEDWYNLNSLFDSPELLSPFYLSAFLDTLMMRGYSIFVVKGQLPNIPVDPMSLKEGPWKLVKKTKSTSSKSTQPGDEELEAALAASELEAAIHASLTQSMPPSVPIAIPDEPEDEELRQALEFSKQLNVPKALPIKEEPPKGIDVSELSIRLLDGQRLNRRFYKGDTVQSIFDFLQTHGVSPDKHKLVCAYPRKEFKELGQTLEQAGLHPSSVLMVQLQ